MLNKNSLIALCFSAIIATPFAHAVALDVNSNFTGGLYGHFDISYQSADPAVKLQSVRFELKSPLFTDPTFNAPGSLPPLSFLITNGGSSTQFAGITGVSD